MSDAQTKGREKAAPVATAGAERARTPARPEATRHEEGSFGRALAAAREARGLSQSDVAAQLRLHLRQVKAIEDEDLAALPEGPFVRGYVRNFARLVDLPAEPLLSLLNAKLRPTEPLRAEGGGSKAVSPIQPMPREPISGRLVIGGAVVALLVFAAFGWWTMRAEQQKEAAAPAESAAPVSAAPAVPPSTASAEPQAAAPPAAAPEPAVAAPEGALKLSFRDRSWVEIRQADGTVLFSQNNPGETVQTIDGVPPYTLVIGNASKVDLEFRGQPVDLAASVSRDGVARLRLE
jgi:cytoskeleton protein RodZ